MKLTIRSTLSGITHTREIPVTQEQLDQWKYGHQLIQDMLPHLTSEDREFILTGITPEEWAEVFNQPEPFSPLTPAKGSQS
jgi:hypothetical protein